jgi:SAM-dependent methyltransferase
LEYVACDFCGGTSSSRLYELKDLLIGRPGTFSLVRCDDCGLLYLNPRPTWVELRKHYPSDYHPFTAAVEDETSRFVRWAKRYGILRRCRAITQRRNGGRLLDIGCSTGLFLNQMQQLNHWEVHGVEPVASAVDFARQRFGLQVFHGTLLDSDYPDQFFDVVTLWDVLEHVAQPNSSLREIYRILRENGLLVLKVPDPYCWQARLFGPSWIGYDAPRHLFGFPREVLTQQLNIIGFDLVDAYSLAGGFYAFTDSMGFWLDRREYRDLGKLFHIAAHSTVVRVSTAPLFSLLRRVGLGSSVTYFARKSSLNNSR